MLEIRSSGTVASEVISEVLAMLDVEESMLDISRESREEIRTVGLRGVPATPASDLDAYPVDRDCRGTGVRRLSARGDDLGRAPPVPRVRQHRLLRLLTPPPRDRPLPRDQHPVMESAEPGEDWRWCYFHHATA